MKYWKITRNYPGDNTLEYEMANSVEELKQMTAYDGSYYVFKEIDKVEYDLHFEKERLIKLAETGQLNTMLTTYFNSMYRRANNLPDSFYVHLTVDGVVRTKKQILNSISALAVNAKYIIAFENTKDFIALPVDQIETFIKDIFVIEENYKTNKNPEWSRLVQVLTVQEYIEEKYTAKDSSILKMIHQLMYINLQGTEHTAAIPDLSGLNLGSLISGGTT